MNGVDASYIYGLMHSTKYTKYIQKIHILFKQHLIQPIHILLNYCTGTEVFT